MLTKLLVNNNSLRELTPNVGRLPLLSLLNAAENNIEKVPAELGQLTSLSKLYLDNNDLLDLNPALGNLVALKGSNHPVCERRGERGRRRDGDGDCSDTLTDADFRVECS